MSDELKQYTLFFKNNRIEKIIDAFCQSSIEISNNSVNNIIVANGISVVNGANVVNGISVANVANVATNGNCVSINSKFCINWKNMHYIWKQYISAYSLPNMIYTNPLKNLLKQRFQYDEHADSFFNVTSKYLPTVRDFILFWEKNILVSLPVFEIEGEMEIDELCNLFKKWTFTSGASVCSSNGSISEHDVLKILGHFFPQVEIAESKYVMNVSCILWDKMTDIRAALESMKLHLIEDGYSFDSCEMIPFDDIYNYYFNYCSSNMVVSKRYFEKCLYQLLGDFIEFDRFVSPEWLLNSFHNT